MASLTVENWIRFFVWLAIGLVFYYFYGHHHSQLTDARIQAQAQGGKIG
jgi:APA family basic amino acid/polyamine antiporter